MNERPKAVAGMVLLPHAPACSTGPAWVGCNGDESTWVNPDFIERVYHGETSVGGKQGVIIETAHTRHFYEMTVASFLEVIAEAWAQRRGR